LMVGSSRHHDPVASDRRSPDHARGFRRRSLTSRKHRGDPRHLGVGTREVTAERQPRRRRPVRGERSAPWRPA
jgi:hypothetical protein